MDKRNLPPGTAGEDMPVFDVSIKDKLDCRLAVSEDTVGDYPQKITCREHKDRVSSLAVYRDHLHCFGCGFHEARPLAALAYLLKITLREVVRVAPKYTNESLDAYRERAATESRRDPMPGSLALIYHEVLLGRRRRRRLEWLKARDLSAGTIADARLGHDGMRFVIPVYDAVENLVSLRYRRDDAYCEETTPKYCGTRGRNGFYIYPEPSIAAAAPECLALCEGELDALLLWQHGIPAVTATNGAGQSPKVIDYVAEHYPSVRRWLVLTDMDDPGEEAARLVGEAAARHGMDATRCAWNRDEAKDVTEALCRGVVRADVLRANCV